MKLSHILCHFDRHSFEDYLFPADGLDRYEQWQRIHVPCRKCKRCSKCEGNIIETVFEALNRHSLYRREGTGFCGYQYRWHDAFPNGGPAKPKLQVIKGGKDSA